MKRRALGRLLAVAAALTIGAASPRASAWDPSTTHLGITDRAAVQSALHLRWMAGSELGRGLFSDLQIDPARLRPEEWRLIMQTIQHTHASAGVQPLGGPGACPGADAPPETTRYCVRGDRWQLTALQWIEFGVIAELVPQAREIHHFVDPDDFQATHWRARGDALPATVVRSRLTRSDGAATAGQITRTTFGDRGPSVAAWFSDEGDPLSPHNLWRHLELAALAPEAEVRDHHLAFALICTGALLHIAQDLSIPAHARADVGAFFTNLSDQPGDRGLALQELARLSYGRSDLPERQEPAAIARARGIALPVSIREQLLGAAGEAAFAGRRFLSPGTIPSVVALDRNASPEDAARELLQGLGLEEAETRGARAEPWPAESGYVLTSTGRPLLAFHLDSLGDAELFLDEAVYRDQMAQLLPRATSTSRAILDTIFPGLPEIRVDKVGKTLEFNIHESLEKPEILVLLQDADGRRSIVKRFTLLPGKRNRIRELPAPPSEQGRVVLVLRSRQRSGDLIIAEHVIAPDAELIPAVPGPILERPPPAVEESDPEASELEPEPELEEELVEEEGDAEAEPEPPAGRPTTKVRAAPKAKAVPKAKGSASSGKTTAAKGGASKPASDGSPSEARPPAAADDAKPLPKTDPPKSGDAKTKTDPSKSGAKTDPPKSGDAKPKTDPPKSGDAKPKSGDAKPKTEPPKSGDTTPKSGNAKPKTDPPKSGDTKTGG